MATEVVQGKPNAGNPDALPVLVSGVHGHTEGPGHSRLPRLPMHGNERRLESVFLVHYLDLPDMGGAAWSSTTTCRCGAARRGDSSLLTDV